MLQLKAIVCLLLSISLACCVQSAESGNFEDADRGSDFVTSSFGDADGQWDLRHSIPGEPEVDYPIYSIAPKTSFSCDNRHEGYYADVETRCQVFRICTNTDLSGEGFAFLCPNGTLFSQRDFVCDWYRNVDCTESENFYFKNEGIGVISDKDELMKTVKEMVEFPMKTITKTIHKSTHSPGSSTKTKPTISQSNRNSNQNRNQSSSGKKGSRISISNLNVPANEDDDINEETQSKLSRNEHKQQKHQQNQHRQRNGGQQNNANRNQPHGKKINGSNGRQKITSSNVDSTESDDSDRFVPPKVYVNSLGELSTDPGVNFDPRSSLIVEPDESSRRGNSNREPKKSLEDVLGDSTSGHNHVEKERREKLKQGLPGTDGKRVRVTGKVKATFTSDDEIKPLINSERVASAAKTKLNFAERINAGLNGFLGSESLEISSNSNGSNIPEFVRNFIDKKGTRTNVQPKHPLDDDHDKFLNLADNVNGGFLNKDHGPTRTHVHKEYHLDETVSYQDSGSNKRKQNRDPKVYNGEDNLSEPIHPSRKSSSVSITSRPPTQSQKLSTTFNNNLNVGQAFHGVKTTESSKTKSVIDEYRSGRQFQFFGSGFTKPGQTPVTLAPFNGKFETNTGNNEYLPPAHVQPFISQVNLNSVKTGQAHNRVSINGPGKVPVQGSTQFDQDQFTNSRQSKKQPIPNRQVIKGPGTVSLGSSLPVQNLLLTDEQNQYTNEIQTPRTPSPYYLPPTQFSSHTHQPASNIPDLFLMVGDINAAEETKSNVDHHHEDAFVKRRAEALLVQGVQQAFFENEYNGNVIDATPPEKNITKLLDSLVIQVDEEDRKDSDVTNIEKLLVGNIRNFLRTSVENEIKNNDRSESTTVDDFDFDKTTVPSILSEGTITSILNSTIDSTTITPNNLYSTFDSATLGTEIESINSTNIAPTGSTITSDLEATTSFLGGTETATSVDELKPTPRVKLNSINMRRLTVKPINYSKKPYTLRTYPKTSSTTKANKLTQNIRRRPLNRFALKESVKNETTSDSNDSDTNTESNDLQAIANSYRSYRPTTSLSRLRIQNETALKYSRNNRYRSSHFIRSRNSTTSTTPSSASATTTTAAPTTVLPVTSSNFTSNTNLSITNLIPFDILSKAIHGNTESTNLQNFNHRFQHNLQEQERFRYTVNNTIGGTQQPYQTRPQSHPKALYTQIPGTNIKISKSNEEASFSFDPQIGLRPQPITASHQTGYVPLDQYITQTLSKTLSSPDYVGRGPSSLPPTTIQPLQHNTNHPTISTQSHNNQFFSYTSSSPNLPTFRPSSVNSVFTNNNNVNLNNNHINRFQQQPSISIIPSTSAIISHPSQINNLQPISNFLNNLQQTTQVRQQQSSINLSNRGGLFTSPGGSDQQDIQNKQISQLNQQSIIRQQELGGFINNNLPTPNPTTSSFSFNQFGNLPPQPILLNSSPQFTQENSQLNGLKGYPPNPLAIFNEIPIAQRRLDLSDDESKSGKSLYSGVSSYHVPLGSVGRLSGDIAASKRLKRSGELFS